MKQESQKALKNLKIGGIYTPIIFGILFLLSQPLFLSLDPNGGLVNKFNDWGINTTEAVGAALLFWGINSYVYFNKYVKTLKRETEQT